LMLQQAEEKNFHFDLQGAVMASDAFFLSWLRRTAKEAGITAVIQPGGSYKDELVLITATKIKLQWYLQERHFKH
jgi:phosphoribosylaminoimidazolecarboxamide formyltransferase/IMP cyclohydrolase